MRKWLKAEREQAGFTMKDMAAKLLISESYYSMIESGERQRVLDLGVAVKLAEIFGITIEQITKNENCKTA